MLAPMRRLLLSGTSAVVMVAMMLVGSLVLWVGVPVAWLWLGSQIQGATDSIGAALGAMTFGVTVSIAALVILLGWLSRKHRELAVARGHADPGNTALEADRK